METLMLLDKHRRRRVEKEAISESKKSSNIAAKFSIIDLFNILGVKPTKAVVSYGHQKRPSPETDDEIESVKNLDFFRSKTMI